MPLSTDLSKLQTTIKVDRLKTEARVGNSSEIEILERVYFYV
jgi:hypothetical protein